MMNPISGRRVTTNNDERAYKYPKTDHESGIDDQEREELPNQQSSSEDEIVVKIVSALYEPCEGQRLLTGDLSNNEAVKIPYTRDVTPILRALLQLQEGKQAAATAAVGDSIAASVSTASTSTTNSRGVLVHKNVTGGDDDDEEEEEDPHMVRLRAISGGSAGMKRMSIPIQALHDGCNSMNTVFGDACPGTSKKLRIHYVIFHSKRQNNHHVLLRNNSNIPLSSEVHHVTFSEYEPVVIRRQVTFYQDDTFLQRATARILAKKSTLTKSLLVSENRLGAKTNTNTNTPPDIIDDRNEEKDDDADDDNDEQTLLIAHRMGRSQSISDFAKLTVDGPSKKTNETTAVILNNSDAMSPVPRLRSATFEIVLPMVLSFLEVPERVECRLVCRLWRNIVRDWGVASIIDSTDPTFQHAFTRPFLRGILAHSYSSLHSLRLSDFDELSPEDLHPSLPHLRKLRVLDISRCTQLNDETMRLLATHVNDTLEVLYIKGLRKVSDLGMVSICRLCCNLTVLDASNVSITDETGILIGGLTKLRALYMRDNFKLTNKSVDAITANCTKLNQLTLWGCVKLKHLIFDVQQMRHQESAEKWMHDNILPLNTFTSGRLVLLSLWGCYSLGDDIAGALATMTQLRSLIVSECHRLTDNFAIGLAQNLPQLVHLHMRYCKRISDDGVNALANGMANLYSLDLSFCTKVTSASICNLLESRHETLSELRLRECHQLQIALDPDDDDSEDGGGRNRSISRGAKDGRLILNSLKSPTRCYSGSSPPIQTSNLSILDIRCCGGQPSPDLDYPETDLFVRGMRHMNFEQRVPGFFSRPARWNATIQARLLRQLEPKQNWMI